MLANRLLFAVSSTIPPTLVANRRDDTDQVGARRHAAPHNRSSRRRRPRRRRPTAPTLATSPGTTGRHPAACSRGLPAPPAARRLPPASATHSWTGPRAALAPAPCRRARARNGRLVVARGERGGRSTGKPAVVVAIVGQCAAPSRTRSTVLGTSPSTFLTTRPRARAG